MLALEWNMVSPFMDRNGCDVERFELVMELPEVEKPDDDGVDDDIDDFDEDDFDDDFDDDFEEEIEDDEFGDDGDFDVGKFEAVD